MIGVSSLILRHKQRNRIHLFINEKEMRKTKKNYQSIPDPYEDMIRINKLDPYEGLIKSNNFQKENNKSI